MEEIVATVLEGQARGGRGVDRTVGALRWKFLPRESARRDREGERGRATTREERREGRRTWRRSITGVKREWAMRIRNGNERVTSVRTAPGWTETTMTGEFLSRNLIETEREWGQERVRDREKEDRRFSSTVKMTLASLVCA
jgi:hypothetical protein